MIKPVRKSFTSFFVVAIATSCFVFQAEAKKKRSSHHAAPGPKPSANTETTISQQTGTASWYGGSFIGRGTASGERYRAGDRTAAHRKLPFGTIVRVTNLTNNRSAIVRINNGGPYIKGRIIDLSKQAATDIAMINSGTARVLLEVLSPAEAAEATTPSAM